MRRFGAMGWAALLVTAALSTGCNDDKAKLEAMTKERDGLITRNRDLQMELEQGKAKETELQQALASRDASLAAKDREIASLKTAKPPVAAPGGTAKAGSTASGWEKGVTADKIEVGSDLLFASGQATLTAAGKAALDKVADDIKAHYGSLPVRVYGYTDSDPIVKTKNLWQDNLDLSANRAMAVTRYLVSKGVSASRIETVAMGEWHPAIANSTAANKAKNRRVEIMVIKA
jgi:outer membrane protein OmpA-like peptidoglycan-associated protein